MARSLAVLATGLPVAPFIQVGNARESYATHSAGFNDEYVFAATRSVNNMDMNPALKVTLFPATIVLDTVFLPFAVIAGFVG